MPFFTGLGMTASMIVALGPQNAYLLKHGLNRQSTVFHIALIYIFIDISLITLGALGIGSLIANAPLLKLAFSIVAVIFFVTYGALSINRAIRAHQSVSKPEFGNKVYWTAILISVANPGVLFDTIVIIGGLAGQYDELLDRFIFSTGAATASLIWFTGLSLLSYQASRFISGANVWRYIDLVIGMLMLFLGYIIAQDAIGLFELNYNPFISLKYF